jgi:hypothetical protein
LDHTDNLHIRAIMQLIRLPRFARNDKGPGWCHCEEHSDEAISLVHMTIGLYRQAVYPGRYTPK